MTSTADPQRARTAERWVLIASILASSMAFIDGSALNVGAARPANRSRPERLRSPLGRQRLPAGPVGADFGGRLAGRPLRAQAMFLAGIAISVASMSAGFADANFLILARCAGYRRGADGSGQSGDHRGVFPGRRRGKAIGTWSTFSTRTTIGGPILGGWLAGHGLWRAVFFINVPLALIALFTLITRVPESRDEHMPAAARLAGAALVDARTGRADLRLPPKACRRATASR